MSNRGAEHPHSGVPTFTTAGETQQSTAERITQLQIAESELWFAAVDAVRHNTQRTILTALQDGMGSCTYQEVEEYASVQRRTIRKHAKKLEDQDLIERIDSRSYVVKYANFDVEVLVSHALDCYYND